jgi:hypothetical protein
MEGTRSEEGESVSCSLASQLEQLLEEAFALYKENRAFDAHQIIKKIEGLSFYIFKNKKNENTRFQ